MKTPCCLLLLAALAAFVSTASAQKAPRIGYVYPAGGQQGSTFEVTVGGQFLTGACEVYCTGGGVQATVIGYERPLSGSETELLRDRLKQLEGQRKSPAAGEAKNAPADLDGEIAAIREKLAKFGNGPQFNIAIAENVKLRVTIAPDASLGDQEIRIATPGGLSNPLLFCVGQLPEVSEPAERGSLKAEIDSKPRGKRRRDAATTAGKPEEIPAVTLPAVVNGQILPGEEDRYRFAARRGQRIVFSVNARKLIPYLPDAVPGWFQATFAICDAQGRELAYVDDFRFNPDPVLCYEFPKDGEYEMAIRDSIYRGREDFVYRITAGELPFITGIFPLGGPAGGQCAVELRGWNLTTGSLAADLRNAKPGLLPLVSTHGRTVSNFVPFAVDALPESAEKEPNNCAAAAQPIVAPLIVNGRIDRPGDIDVYSIAGKAGDEIVAEIVARRLNSPLDSVLTLTDAAGAQIAMNDDHEDKGAGLTTHHADSRLSVKLPAGGAYLLRVADAQHGGGADYAYRLRVSAPEPDFELRIAPASVSGRAGGNVPVTVYALRKDGFNGEIAVSSLTGGFQLSGGKVPAGKDQAQMTLTLPQTPTEEPVALDIEGRATIGARIIIHRAAPAEDMQQAFAYHHLVPAKELRAAVAGRLTVAGQMKIVNPLPVKIPAGGAARVQIAATIGDKAPTVQLELSDPPEGIAVKTAALSPDGAEIEFASDPTKVVAGMKGSLIVQAFSTRTGANGKPRRIPLGALPAIPFEIVGE